MPTLYLTREDLAPDQIDEVAGEIEDEAVEMMGNDRGRVVLVPPLRRPYRLLFVPADPTLPEFYAAIEAPNDTVIESFISMSQGWVESALNVTRCLSQQPTDSQLVVHCLYRLIP